MPPRAAPIDIGIFLPFNLSITRGILDGINRFRAEQPSLKVEINEGPEPDPTSPPSRAVILFNAAAKLSNRRSGTPFVVNLSNRSAPGPVMHSVLNDDVAVGRMAADHLLERGFRRFAFLAVEGAHFSELRYAGFRERLRARLRDTGLEVPRGDLSRGLPFLRTLHDPCGLLAATDHTAARAVDFALDGGLRIPDGLAILGVDDDPVRCALSRVDISSVRLNSERQGYMAMRLATDLIEGRRPARPLVRIRIPPLGVTSRRSTDTFAVSHAGLAAVMRALHDQIQRLHTVADLARLCGLGPRTLARLVQNHLQTSPGELLNESRFRFARSLLVQTNLTVGEIAERAGYHDVRTLIWQCRRRTGATPSALRRKLTPE